MASIVYVPTTEVVVTTTENVSTIDTSVVLNQVTVSNLQGPQGAKGDTGATGATGQTGAAGQAGLDWISGLYYRSINTTGGQVAVANTTYYTPLIVPSSLTVDRIGILTASNFSGTATVRFGIYSNVNGVPATLLLDAGTVSATAASSVYQITISQALTAGIYWLAANTQTIGTTNTFEGCNAPRTVTVLGLPLNSSNANYFASGYSQAGVTGAFANASSPTRNHTTIAAIVRKA